MVQSWPTARAEECVDSCILREIAAPGEPFNIVASQPGHVWFTMPKDNALGVLIIQSNVVSITTYTIPTANSHPYDLIYDGPRDAIWFTENQTNQLGRFDIATNEFTEFALPNNDGEPKGIDLAPDGSIWFTESGTNQLTQFKPDAASFQSYQHNVLNKSGHAGLEDIAVKNNDSIWYTASAERDIFEFRPTSNSALRSFFNSQSFGLTITGSGSVWATDFEKGLVRKFVPGTLAAWVDYATTPLATQPIGIAHNFMVRDQIYVAAQSNGALVRVQDGSRTGLTEKLPLPPSAAPYGMTVDNNGNVWVTDMGRSKILMWQPPFFRKIWLPITMH